MGLWLAGEPEADALLSAEPLALLIGMVLDQQIPLEHAFAGPLELQRRLGTPLRAKKIAAMDQQALRDVFSQSRSIHRFPGSMADRVRAMCELVATEWSGRPEEIWTTAPSGAELYRRVLELPGFGDQKARIFVALLGKQLNCRPRGWRAAATPYGDAGTTMSIADITDAASKQKVRAYKQAKKAEARAATS